MIARHPAASSASAHSRSLPDAGSNRLMTSLHFINYADATRRRVTGCSRAWQCIIAMMLLVLSTPSLASAAQTIAKPFSDFNFLPAGGALFYDIIAYDAVTQKVPDLQVTLKSTGAVDVAAYIYCNPSWKTAELRTRPGPSNAMYRSEEDVLANIIYIDSNNDLARPPNIRDPRSPEFAKYVPSYNCSVISNDQLIPTRIQIDVSYNYRDISLTKPEQDALRTIWDKCCAAQINDTILAAAEAVEDPTTASPALDAQCGRWSAVNNLYGDDPKIPFVDFCLVAGNQCTPEGRLSKLDLSSYGLSCPFPVDAFSAFEQLQTLDISDNFEMSGKISDVFETLQDFSQLQLLDLSDSSGFSGPLIPPRVKAADAGLCSLASSNLMVLNIAGIGLPGATLPPCLFNDNSVLQELRVEFNQLTGSIPNVFSANSKLRVITALSSGLNGPIPPSLALTKQFEVMDLGYNFLTGTIPIGMGSSPYLRYLSLASNELTGLVPESLAVNSVLETLDLSQNQLRGLPAQWTNPSLKISLDTSALRNLQLHNNSFSGPFPLNLLSLRNLTLLNMANNAFAGVLPEEEGMFGQLRTFNASGNKLTGVIPTGYASCGVFTLPQVNALGNVLQQSQGIKPSEDQGNTLVAQPHIFDVSRNQLSGEVPVFMWANNVPDYVRPNVNLMANRFAVECDGASVPEQLQYLQQAGHLCPQTTDPAALDNVDSQTAAAEDTAATSSGVQGSLDVTGRQISRGSSSGSDYSSSKGGLPGYAIALITVLIVLIILALIAWVGITYWRARARGEPFSVGLLFPTRHSHRKQFNDLEMTSGMDPLGFGPSPTAASQMLGNGHISSHPLKFNRNKGGFL